MTGHMLPGDVVPVSATLAAELIQLPGFADLRRRLRVTPEYAQAMALYRAGLSVNSVPPDGTGGHFRAAGIPSWLTTRQAAELLGLTERAVRKRLALGQLDGTKQGSAWCVSRRAVEKHMSGGPYGDH